MSKHAAATQQSCAALVRLVRLLCCHHIQKSCTFVGCTTTCCFWNNP